MPILTGREPKGVKAKPNLWRHLLEERGKASTLLNGGSEILQKRACLVGLSWLLTLTDAIKSLHPGTAGDLQAERMICKSEPAGLVDEGESQVLRVKRRN